MLRPLMKHEIASNMDHYYLSHSLGVTLGTSITKINKKMLNVHNLLGSGAHRYVLKLSGCERPPFVSCCAKKQYEHSVEHVSIKWSICE